MEHFMFTVYDERQDEILWQSQNLGSEKACDCLARRILRRSAKENSPFPCQ